MNYFSVPYLDLIAEVEVGQGQLGDVTVNGALVVPNGSLRRVNLGLAQAVRGQNSPGRIQISAVIVRPAGAVDRASVTVELYQLIPRGPDGTPVFPSTNPNQMINFKDNFQLSGSFDQNNQITLTGSIALF